MYSTDSLIFFIRHSSLLHHLLALEAGVQLAGYNVVLLLKEMEYDQVSAVVHKLIELLSQRLCR